MSTVYKSRFTGTQIDNGVELALNANKVAANTDETPTEELDTLRVGAVNYEIPKPIDVEANPATVGQTNLENLKVGDTVYKIPEQITPTVIKANPSADATTDLTKLQVGTTIYGIPEGGGTEVIANPTETGTTDLTSLKVGETVYNIPSGGSTDDALAGTWMFNDAITVTVGSEIYNQTIAMNFKSNNVEYSTIRVTSTAGTPNLFYGDTKVYKGYEGAVGEWEATAYKTIEITSKLSEVTNGDTLLTWLQANATKQESGGEPSGISVNKGSMFKGQFVMGALGEVYLFNVIAGSVYYPMLKSEDLDLAEDEFYCSALYRYGTSNYISEFEGSFVDTSGNAITQSTFNNKLVIPTSDFRIAFEP